MPFFVKIITSAFIIILEEFLFSRWEFFRTQRQNNQIKKDIKTSKMSCKKKKGIETKEIDEKEFESKGIKLSKMHEFILLFFS